MVDSPSPVAPPIPYSEEEMGFAEADKKACLKTLQWLTQICVSGLLIGTIIASWYYWLIGIIPIVIILTILCGRAFSELRANGHD